LILVTGAAGFIGSHLVERLLETGETVRGFDNLSTGKRENLANAKKSPNFEFMHGDCLNQDDLKRALIGVKHVFHFAADPEIRKGTGDPGSQFRQNILATHLLLEEIRRRGTIDSLVLASTSTVYGNAKKLPTPEDYGPLCPISTYGATKLACEGLCSSYAESYGFNTVVLRLANIVGLRSLHGVIPDLIAKIQANPERLDVLGDGTQTKSYLHVRDALEGILLSWKKKMERVNIINVGSDDCLDVASVAKIVIHETKANARINFSGGTRNGAGWVGDVKEMWLDTSRLREMGWRPSMNSAEAVKMNVRELLDTPLHNR
jgi:UDP-glucose 4-epimerase